MSANRDKKNDDKPESSKKTAVDIQGKYPRYNIQKDTLVFEGIQDVPPNSRRVTVIIVASILASLVATVIVTTIYRCFFNEE